MIDSEMQRYIRQEIARQVHIVFTGVSSDAKTHTETINNFLPGASALVDRPLVQPYGFASKSADGTLSAVVRQGDHPGNLLTIGHRDKDKPDDLAKGESAMYSVGKYQIRVLKTQVQVGKAGAWETVVVGDTLSTLLKLILDHIIAHKHLGNLGFQTSPPMNAADFADDKTQVDKILAKDGGKF